MRNLLFLFLCIFCFSTISFSQKTEYSNKCDLVKDLLDSADFDFFIYANKTQDSTITILDINGILTECNINLIRGVKVILINSGSEVEKIRKESIFSASTEGSNIFVFLKTRRNKLTQFMLYHPKSNGSYEWLFTIKNKHYYFKKKSSGWF